MLNPKPTFWNGSAIWYGPMPVDEYIRRVLRRAYEKPSPLDSPVEWAEPATELDPDDIDLEPGHQLVDEWGGVRKIPVRYEEAIED